MTGPGAVGRRGERGQATVELVALLPIVVVVAMLAVQLLLFVSTGNAVEAAARNGALGLRDGLDPRDVVVEALSDRDAAALRPGDVRVSGETVEVELRVPVVHPWFRTEAWTVTRSVTVPTGG